MLEPRPLLEKFSPRAVLVPMFSVLLPDEVKLSAAPEVKSSRRSLEP